MLLASVFLKSPKHKKEKFKKYIFIEGFVSLNQHPIVVKSSFKLFRFKVFFSKTQPWDEVKHW